MVKWIELQKEMKVLRGKRLTRNLLDDNASYPVFHGGIEPLGKYGDFNREANTVMVINVGASAGTVGYCDSRFWSSDGCFCISHSEKINSKFLYYYMLGKKIYFQSQVRYAGIPTLDNSVLERIPIPILSLTEQTRIVGILDTFTASIENLKLQIAERRKQYEHYRDQLLDLEGKEGVEIMKLGNVCTIKGEYGLSVPSKSFDGVRYIRITDITDSGTLNNDCVSADCEEVDKEPLKDGDILFARTGATVGKTLIYLKQYGECLYAGYLIRYRINKNIVLPKYIFHFTHSNQYNMWVKSNLVEGAQPNINAQKYNSLGIPVPSLDEQSHIVSILDTFEASISNLEAQLKEREKQYEYYRNKLLTFE